MELAGAEAVGALDDDDVGSADPGLTPGAAVQAMVAMATIEPINARPKGRCRLVIRGIFT
jgi:hypothetical protein